MWTYGVKRLLTSLVFRVSSCIVNNLKWPLARKVSNISIDEIEMDIMVRLVKFSEFSYAMKILLYS